MPFSNFDDSHSDLSADGKRKFRDHVFNRIIGRAVTDKKFGEKLLHFPAQAILDMDEKTGRTFQDSLTYPEHVFLITHRCSSLQELAKLFTAQLDKN